MVNHFLFLFSVSPNKDFGDFAAFDKGSNVAKPSGYVLPGYNEDFL